MTNYDRKLSKPTSRGALGLLATAATGALLCSGMAMAGTLEQAKRMHDRLAGVPPTESVLLAMKAELDAGDAMAAAEIAMENDSFYNETIKNWAAPWTNREQNVFVPLNDYTATVIGFVRDELDFRELLYADIIYVGDGITPSYSNSSNAHYQAMEDAGVSLKDTLDRSLQSEVTGLPAEATSGVVTSRAASKAFLIAGTNRAAFRFTLMNHMCMDLEQVHDITRVPDRIRQDVSRSPGGDARVFLNGCMGCHAGMDPMAQGLAYYNYEYDPENDLTGENGQLVYNSEGDIDPETGTRVQAKYHFNSATFPYGFVTPDDKWDNYWREGVNKSLGWDESLPGSGNGAKTMMMEMAHSQAFAQCQVKKVFKTVCLRDPDADYGIDGADGNPNDQATLNSWVTDFAANGYNIKRVFAQAADYCKGN
ncbi:hypothetical protein [Saccharophagus degradans]|uniref:hypothetical protein n=1 Tax=Saccharophagus degradans TaxID=86304 RepID=UPI003F6109A6